MPMTKLICPGGDMTATIGERDVEMHFSTTLHLIHNSRQG